MALLRLTPDGFPDDTFGDGSGARVYEVGFFQTSRLEVTPAADAAYRRIETEYNFVRADGVLVEPHWDVIPWYFCLPLDIDGFWSRSVTIPHSLSPSQTGMAPISRYFISNAASAALASREMTSTVEVIISLSSI